MSRKPTLTGAGLLAESYGRRPYVVTLREEKEPGANVLLDYTDASGRRRKPSLGYPVRHRDARNRWVWDWEALERAREAQEDRNAELRLRIAERETKVEHLTVRAAFARFHDPESGGLPASKGARNSHKLSRTRWEQRLGPDTPWNRVTPNQVWGLVKEYRDRGMAPTARELLKNLRTVSTWLRKKARIRHLEDPTEGLEIVEAMGGHIPRRPRYTPSEVAKICKVRHQVDPRFALFLALMEDSGARREALRRAMRSGLDCPLDQPPSEEQAPLGWLSLPGLKGQDAPLAFLTPYQRRELDAALTGYLRELERLYQETGRDYPLFPAARVKDAAGQVIRPVPVLRGELTAPSRGGAKGRTWRRAQGKAYQPVSQSTTDDWLREAEGLAGVPHVEGRLYHGMRRMVSDYLYAETDLKTMTVGMAWSSEKVPEQIYIDRARNPQRSKVREAHERKRRESDTQGRGTDGEK